MNKAIEIPKPKFDTSGIIATILGILLTISIGYFIALGDRISKVETNVAIIQSNIEIINKNIDQSSANTDSKIDKLSSKVDKLTDYLIEKGTK